MTESLIRHLQIFQLPQFVWSKELVSSLFLLNLEFPERISVCVDISLVNGFVDQGPQLAKMLGYSVHAVPFLTQVGFELLEESIGNVLEI